MSKPDNPPAFPLPDQYTPNGQPVMQGSGGMTLLDYFAGQALMGLLANPKLQDTILKRQSWVAESAFYWAKDALEAREQIRREPS